MAMLAPQAVSATSQDKLPSGSWGFGPINIQWSLEDNDEVDIQVSVLGINVDKLSGTLNANNASVDDNLDILGIVKGDLTFTAKYNQGPGVDGLWVSGQVSAGPWNSGQMNHRIVPW